MITYQSEPQSIIPINTVKIVGLGGAGANMLERIVHEGFEGAELLALNTDIRTLNACGAGEKIQLGRELTKGLGAGGDPDLGYQAMLEAEPEIRAALRGRRIVFLCVGLGGGTGSGAAPVITRIAREEGAFVVVFATMPFAFEGRRRREQAETTLNELAVLSNALVTFDNNRMGELVLAEQGIHEAFLQADRMICESIKAVIRLVIQPGIINVGLDDLMSALRTNRSRCLFGSGIARGKDRATEALRNALSSPLLDQGTLLKEAQTVLVHLCGGKDLTLYEVEALMQRLQKYVPDSAHVLFGAAIDPSMGDNLSVTLISALPEDALAAAPRESLSAAAGAAFMDPQDSFAAPSKSAPAPASAVPERAPAAAKPATRAASPAAPAPQPVQAKPQPAKQESAKSEIPKPEVPKSEASPAPQMASLFDDDDRPFAEPAPAVAPVVSPAPASASPFKVVSQPSSEPAKPVAAAPAPAAAVATETGTEDVAQEASPGVKVGPFTFKPLRRSSATGSATSSWPKTAIPPRRDQLKQETETPANPEPVVSAPAPEPRAVEAKPVSAAEPASSLPESEPPKLKLGVKSQTPQNELAFDSAPRGRFEGQGPNVVDGEDLDLPPFLRKKKQS